MQRPHPPVCMGCNVSHQIICKIFMTFGRNISYIALCIKLELVKTSLIKGKKVDFTQMGSRGIALLFL